MKNKINPEAIAKLIQHSKDDDELLEFIAAALNSFEGYHIAVMEEQLLQLIYSGGGMEGEQYRTKRTDLDKQRTNAHNALIASVNLLNRMAANAGIEPVYDGTVSETKPFRRQVANAVFEYVSFLIDHRN